MHTSSRNNDNLQYTPVVAVDLDGVIFDFVSWFEKHLDNPPVINHYTYSLEKRYDIDGERVKEVFESNPWNDMDVFHDAQKAIDAIRFRIKSIVGVRPEIVILTDTIKSKRQDRIEALNTAGITFDRIVFTDGDKREWIRKEQPSILFDDRPDYVQCAIKNLSIGVLIDRYGIFENWKNKNRNMVYAESLLKGVDRCTEIISLALNRLSMTTPNDEFTRIICNAT
ncbi:MAG: hypothetical protein D6732_17585 [Methanobacteriota archaeon]|nr:MAG: hypothetical protein D6732_17585 [Euryarchaeota archaeon]